MRSSTRENRSGNRRESQVIRRPRKPETLVQIQPDRHTISNEENEQ